MCAFFDCSKTLDIALGIDFIQFEGFLNDWAYLSDPDDLNMIEMAAQKNGLTINLYSIEYINYLRKQVETIRRAKNIY